MGIRENADKILFNIGLLKALKRHGKIYIVGSYQMDLMTINDLDILVEANNHSRAGIFALANDLNILLNPYFSECEDYRRQQNNFFYGCETDIIGERWNIDVWFKKEEEIYETIKYCEETSKRILLDPLRKKAIVDIKSELVKLCLYGIDKNPKKHYHSKEIYEAVLDNNILSFEEFIKRYSK